VQFLNSEQISQLLCSELDDCQISVEGDGGKFLVTVIGKVFDGLNSVKRQQKIYQILNEHISNGEIHAVSMRLFTAEEFQSSH
jgi:acid stress-induced BolA-like protein IbaG/YrbA